MKKIKITTLGCKVNQYESAAFQTGFEEKGHHIVSKSESSDIVIINTCTVTGKAGKQSRQAVRKAIRENPSARIVITGCHTEIAGDELSELKELHDKSVLLVGNGDKHLLVDAVLNERAVPFSTLAENEKKNLTLSPLPVKKFHLRTRAYLKIQDGCNSFCTYCIVPHTRGRSRSLSVDHVLKQAKSFESEGYKEIVVTGIHVGNYGIDLKNGETIGTIMDKLCKATPAMRYRLSSIEPMEISQQLIDVMNENVNFMPHLHIPLQSGSDAILLRMNRRYTTDKFKEVVQNCYSNIDNLAVGIDVLGGFPGETEQHFHETLQLLEELDFTYLHVFPYSRRPGTPAADFDMQIEKTIKDRRVTLIRELGESKRNHFYTRYIGTIRSVLVEAARDSNGLLKGFTDNYIPVHFHAGDNLRNCITKVKIVSQEGTYMAGEIVQKKHER